MKNLKRILSPSVLEIDQLLKSYHVSYKKKDLQSARAAPLSYRRLRTVTRFWSRVLFWSEMYFEDVSEPQRADFFLVRPLFECTTHRAHLWRFITIFSTFHLDMWTASQSAFKVKIDKYDKFYLKKYALFATNVQTIQNIVYTNIFFLLNVNLVYKIMR